MDLDSENAYNTPYANTTIMPLLLLSLLQQKNAPKTKTTFKKEYDYVIVGGGSAGSVVASRLSEVPCVSVLLLEAGKSPPLLTDVPQLGPNFYESDISWPYVTVSQKHSGFAMVDQKVSWPSGKTLGGSSVLNGMAYVRGDMNIYDGWAKNGAVGWSASDLRPYFFKLENYTDPEYLSNGYHVADGPVTIERPNYNPILQDSLLEAARELGYKIVDTNGRVPMGFQKTDTTTRNGQRCSTAKAYLVPAENRTNLDIVTNAFVQKVVIKNKKATGVLFEHGGEVHEVKACKEVIMSAGTVNSAQLLMLSGIGPREHLEHFEIPVVADLPVGKNFLDNCGTFLFYEMNSSIPNLIQKLTNISNVEDYIENRKGILTNGGALIFAFLARQEFPDIPDIQLIWGENVAPGPTNSLGMKPEVNSVLLYEELK